MSKAAEKLLLNESVAKSMEKAASETIKEAKKAKVVTTTTNIAEVPHKSILWSKKTVFYVFNIQEGTEQEVLGSQARSLLGSNLSAIKAMERGEKAQVMTDRYIIKFVEYKV